jgi:hypothetical protein
MFVFYHTTMDTDQKLHDYRIGEFTDDDVVRCTGLSVRGWRELIKFRLVRTITENIRGRGHVRLCDAMVFKRAATIAAINRAGFNLQVAGWIAYFAPFHTTLYEICDPGRGMGTSGTRTGLGVPPRLRRARAEWFDPSTPAQVRSNDDWWIKVYDRRFVGITYCRNDQPIIFGDLRDGCARFVAWLPHHNKTQFLRSRIAKLAIAWAPSAERLPDVVAEWEKPIKFTRELRSLGYEFENHPANDALRTAAEATVCNPLSITTINISLAIRRAIRRYLSIEQIEPASKSDNGR